MDRKGTGAICTNEVMRLELSGLIRDGMIKKHGIYSSVISWTSGGSVSIETINTKDEKYIRLSYSTVNGNKMDYKIRLDSIPSNLGTGEVLYFICPITGERCRILYSTYGSDIFKSRLAYDTRIYYRLQQTSKNWLHNTRYWNLTKRIQKLQDLRFTDTYRGRKTRRALLIEQLKKEQLDADNLRCISLVNGAKFKNIIGVV